ncbi:hypothetical protein BV22DRAFT_1134981 [Leucogyrophana mollusca]|uniref:Uncharacterized protein n=1 Tax=Leucogyrophana mollusca TaxID=85980 RepID=A0ACB8AXN7_9AGAM|nr:hypothetical protein BV22DRAFT_1134981 [Leucogyrophana mollusca]
MLDTGFYLRDGALRDNVQWVCDGRADRLAIKLVVPVDKDGGEGNNLSQFPSPPSEGLELATICAVVKISDRDYWLTADAGFHGPSIVCKELSEATVSCAAEQPDMALFKDEFSTIVNNLHWLQDQVATPGYSIKKGLFLMSTEIGSRFKVHHALFEALGSDELGSEDLSEQENTENKTDTDENAVFMIKNWLTSNDTAANALDTIKEMHRVIPILAYSMDGKLITPSLYRC